MVTYHSRAQMIRMIENGEIDTQNDAIISINDDDVDFCEMHEMLYKLYHGSGDRPNERDRRFTVLMFSDVNSVMDGGMSQLQATMLVHFINSNGPDKNYRIHCLAGVSRSATVAKFINEYFDLDIQKLTEYPVFNHGVWDRLHSETGTSLNAYYRELERDQYTNENFS